VTAPSDANKKGNSGIAAGKPTLRRLLSALAVLPLLIAIAVYVVPAPLSVFTPDVALWLNPRHPTALLAKAERLREDLQRLTGPDAPITNEGPTSVSAAQPTAEALQRRSRVDRNLPEAGPGRFAKPILDRATGEYDAAGLREEIASLAKRALERAPLEARAYRLLAETRSDRTEVRDLMRKAAARSPRETFALAWLMADAADRGDMAILVDAADKIMRTRPQLVPAVTETVAIAVRHEEGRKLVVQRLADYPNWRETFLKVLPVHIEDGRSLLVLFEDVSKTANPPTVAEVTHLLAALLGREEAKVAHDAWRSLVPRNASSDVGTLYNGGFDRPFSGYAFDWVPTVGDGAAIDQLEDQPGSSNLRIRFDGRRVRGLSVRQIVLLAPGNYRMTGEFMGWLAAQRGVRWQVRCLYGSKEVLGQTELLSKGSGEWEAFDMQFQVIDVDDCKAQMIVLIHDSRTASEEIVSGEIQFKQLQLVAEEAEARKMEMQRSEKTSQK
jgi:hypothetical protein